jgi:HK97 family phage portal protein
MAKKAKKSWLSGAEGSWRGPFTGIGEFGGMFSMGPIEDGWQRNIRPAYFDHTKVSIVYSCVQAYARAVSACPIQHTRLQDDGEHQIQNNSWTGRLLRNPNSYETWAQHIYNIVSELGFHGNSVCIIVRDNRSVPVSLHRVPHGSWSLFIEPESKEIFYSIYTNSNTLIDVPPDYLVPARDIIHFRQHCPRHPLLGESPVTAAALAVGINVALNQSQIAFFNQMRRPSGVLTTDEKLTRDQIIRLRDAFDEQSKKWAQGGMPVLSNGLKYQQLSISSQDAQLIDAQKMSNDDVSRVYSVPGPIVNIMTQATFANSETLINHWLATGLGSMLENLEQTYSAAFGFGYEDNLNFDTDALLRSDFRERAESLKVAVTGALLTPNEARRKLKLKPVEGGDNVFLQQQNFPIDLLPEYAHNVVSNLVSRNTPSQNDTQASAATPSADTEQSEEQTAEREFDKEFNVNLVRKLLRDKIDHSAPVTIDGEFVVEDNSIGSHFKRKLLTGTA